MNTYEPFNPRRRAVFAVASTAASAVVFAAVLLLFDRASRLDEPVLARAPAASPARVPTPAPAAPVAVAANGPSAAIVADASCAASDAPATCAPPWGLNP